MAIRDYFIEQNKMTARLEIHTKNFKELGYWIRTIKEKIGKRKILDMKVDIQITYIEDNASL